MSRSSVCARHSGGRDGEGWDGRGGRDAQRWIIPQQLLPQTHAFTPSTSHACRHTIRVYNTFQTYIHTHMRTVRLHLCCTFVCVHD